MQSETPQKGFHFYENDICPFCKPTAYLLQANKIPFEGHQIDLSAGEQKGEAYTKINPFQKVPAIVDDGYIIIESSTVIRYVCNSKEVAEHWYPKDPKKRGLVDLYFDWHSSNIGNLVKYLYAKLGYGTITVEEAKAISDKAWQELENVFLSRRKFLSSDDKITVADLALFWHLGGLIDIGYEFSPRVKEYHQNVLDSEPGLKESLEGYLTLGREWKKKIATKKQEEAQAQSK